MKTTVLAVSLLLTLATNAAAQEGLWAATLRFGPDIRGPLLIYRTPDGWRADIAGFSVPARREGQSFAFELPDGKGSFRAGHWIQSDRFATPVRLVADGKDRWRGMVNPLDGSMTLYLPVTRQPDGTLRTYVRNPERNWGRFIRVSRIEVNGKDVHLVGRDTIQGRYEDDVISVPIRGLTFDFTRVTDSSSSPFYPRVPPRPVGERGSGGEGYRYTPPLQLADGWPVASLDDVGISRDSIERLVQLLIDMPMDSVNTLQIHSLLIARHGKLVLDEYFHGYHRDLPHDTRSAAKSWTATLIGAAMQAGVPLRLETPVYQTMLGTLPADLDPRKRAITLEHLLTMTAGFNCDPDDTTSADEDIMNNAGVQDWYGYTLNVPLISAPGEKIFYCSTEPNLAGGMLAKVAREPLATLFARLIARPLQMRNYYLGTNPNLEAYGGGGHRFVPRDFLKFAQLMLNGGRWKGRQIVSSEWARQSTAPLRDLSTTTQYGYLWNSSEFEYNGRKVRAFLAGGNGGQVFMGFPDLDLVVGFTGGNYNDSPVPSQRVLLTQYLLRAVN